MRKSTHLLGAAILASLPAITTAQSYVNPLLVPKLVTGSSIALDVEASTHNFNPNGGSDSLNKFIPTYCYNVPGEDSMSYLGPTMVWNKTTMSGAQNINMTNNLPNGEPTTTHWHGINLPSEDDGGPHEVYPSAMFPDFNPSFPVLENPSTCWYHSHMMDSTTEQVSLGLAGMIIIQDPNDNLMNLLPSQYKMNDLPIVIQEKAFTAGGNGINLAEKPGNGKITLVNGSLNPYRHVPMSMVRLRVLNGSIRKSFQFGISTSRTSNNTFDPMWLIGTDGGYTQMPYSMDSAVISPGERMEMVIDFGQYGNGDTVFLRNLNRSLDGTFVDGGASKTPGVAFMAFIVDNSMVPTTPITSLPAVLDANYATMSTADADTTRLKTLFGGHSIPFGHGNFTIDHIEMNMDSINDIVLVNTKEVWTVWNRTQINHPWHIHKIQFQVTQILDSIGISGGNVIFDTLDIPDYLKGWKDNVLVRAGWKLSYVARFDHFPDMMIDPMNGFMYHCHILTHEDIGMMHQFVVVDPMALSVLKEETSGFTLFPNPAGDRLNLQGETKMGGTFRIVDLLGRTLHEEKVAAFNGAVSFDVSSMPRGIVVAEFYTGARRFSKQVRLD